MESLVIAYLPNDAKDELTECRQGLSKDMQAALSSLGVKEKNLSPAIIMQQLKR